MRKWLGRIFEVGSEFSFHYLFALLSQETFLVMQAASGSLRDRDQHVG